MEKSIIILAVLTGMLIGLFLAGWAMAAEDLEMPPCIVYQSINGKPVCTEYSLNNT